MKIMIAEDSKIWQGLLRILLKGHELVFVQSIGELKQMGREIAQGTFGAIILDDNLLDGSCFLSGAAQWVREQNADIRIALNSTGPCPDLVDWIGATDLAKNLTNIQTWLATIQSTTQTSLPTQASPA